MAESELSVANGALLRLGAEPLASLTELTDRARLCSHWMDKVRKQTLRAHPWNFAIGRQQLSTYPQSTLTLAATSGSNILVTASVDTFAASDVGYRLVATPSGSARITSYISAIQVRADIETTFSGTTYNPTEWRIAPAFGFAFRYAKPSSYLRLIEIEPASGRIVGSSGSLLSMFFAAGNAPERAKVEGQHLVTDVGPKANLIYIQDVEDTTFWDALFDDAVEALLAFRICYGVTGSLQAAKTQWDSYRAALAEARTVDGQEGGYDDSGSDALIAVRY